MHLRILELVALAIYLFGQHWNLILGFRQITSSFSKDPSPNCYENYDHLLVTHYFKKALMPVDYFLSHVSLKNMLLLHCFELLF